MFYKKFNVLHLALLLVGCLIFTNSANSQCVNPIVVSYVTNSEICNISNNTYCFDFNVFGGDTTPIVVTSFLGTLVPNGAGNYTVCGVPAGFPTNINATDGICITNAGLPLTPPTCTCNNAIVVTEVAGSANCANDSLTYSYNIFVTGGDNPINVLPSIGTVVTLGGGFYSITNVPVGNQFTVNFNDGLACFAGPFTYPSAGAPSCQAIPMLNAKDDVVTTNVGECINIAVLLNDNPGNSTFNTSSLKVVGNPTNGTTTVNLINSEITYCPNSTLLTSDIFTYEICDNEMPANCENAHVTININQCPTTGHDVASTAANTPVTIAILSNDLDLDGSIVISSLSLKSTPANGMATANSSLGVVNYTPNAGFSGSDVFTYEICDNNGCCVDEVVNVNIACATSPTAGDNNYTTPEDVQITMSVLNNDVTGGTGLNLASLTIVLDPSNGTATPTMLGNIAYVPNANYNGIDVLKYSICDNNGCCDIATVDITISDVNDLPILIADTIVTNVNVTASTQVLNNDNDIDGTLALNTLSIVSNAANGMASINNMGVATYVPNTDFCGVDEFEYELCDNDGGCSVAKVLVSVICPPESLEAVDDSYTTNEDIPITVSVLDNDLPGNSPIDITCLTIITSVSNGSLALDTPSGKITYTPSLNYSGTDCFTYSVCDVLGFVDTAEACIDVIEVDDVIAANDNYNSQPSRTIVIDPLLNDTIPCDTPLLSIVTNPTFGSLVINPDNTIAFIAGTEAVEDCFVYRICCDNNCDTARVCVDVSTGVTIPNGFSPNNDGINDFFEVVGIEFYQNSKLEVFNRWGSLVYEKEMYDNSWNGIYQENSGDLADGTYFFVLTLDVNNLEEENNLFKGFLTIHR